MLLAGACASDDSSRRDRARGARAASCSASPPWPARSPPRSCPWRRCWRWRVAPRQGGRRRGRRVLAGRGRPPSCPGRRATSVVIGDPVLIETVGIWNVWTDNAFVDPHRYDVQALRIHKEPTPAGKRRAWRWPSRVRGLRESPGAFARKVVGQLRALPPARGAAPAPDRGAARGPPGGTLAALLLDDAVLVAAVLLVRRLRPWRAAGARPRALVLLWMAYYLFMVVVVFHNEIRYRSAFVPFLLAGAAARRARSCAIRRRGAGQRRRAGVVRRRLAAAVLMIGPFVVPAGRSLASWWTLRPARAAIERGDLAAASTAAFAAAGRDPGSPRPWLTYGRWLVAGGASGRGDRRLRARRSRRPDHWTPRLVLPRLLREAGRAAKRPTPPARGQRSSRWNVDPWLALEVAWRELPPPRDGRDPARAGRLRRGARLPPSAGRPPLDAGIAPALRLVPRAGRVATTSRSAMGSPEPSPMTRPAWRSGLARGRQRRVVHAHARRSAPTRCRRPPPRAVRCSSRSERPPGTAPASRRSRACACDRMTVVPAR